MKNWTRYVPTTSGQHGPQNEMGERATHIGLNTLANTKEVQKELARRKKRHA